MIAKIEPTIHCQTVAVAGRFNASSKPVTVALKSKTVCFLLLIRLKINSDTTAVTTHTPIISSALKPNKTTAITVAGASAINTSSIMFCVVTGLLMCGDVDTINFFILHLLLLLCLLFS